MPANTPETARVPMVEVPVQLLERCLDATNFALACDDCQVPLSIGAALQMKQLRDDLADALAAH